MARGLGSSATGVVAGALAANRLLGDPLSLDEILALVVGVEGHPDNVSPALLGALTASARIGAATLTHQYQPHPDWRLALHVPAYALSTALARAALPARVPLADAVFNLTRTPLIVDTLVSGDARELAALLEDRLHEPYRRRSIHRYAAIRKAALEAGGAAVFLSGAGPTMAAFCMGDRAARRVADAMLAAAPRRSGAARALVLRPSLKGACVESDAAERGRAALRRR
jgi:homoserine kinase